MSGADDRSLHIEHPQQMWFTRTTSYEVFLSGRHLVGQNQSRLNVTLTQLKVMLPGN